MAKLGLPESTKNTLFQRLGNDGDYDYIKMVVYMDKMDEVFSDTYDKPEDAFAHFADKEVNISPVREHISGSIDIEVSVGEGRVYTFSFFAMHHNTEGLSGFICDIMEDAA